MDILSRVLLMDNSNALIGWFYAKMYHFRSVTAKLLLAGSLQGYKLSFHVFQMCNGNAFIGLFCTGMDRFMSFRWETATLIFALNRDISFYSFWIGNGNAFLICSMQGCIFSYLSYRNGNALIGSLKGCAISNLPEINSLTSLTLTLAIFILLNIAL